MECSVLSDDRKQLDWGSVRKVDKVKPKVWLNGLSPPYRLTMEQCWTAPPSPLAFGPTQNEFVSPGC